MSIYIKEWLAIHPYQKQQVTDMYYMKLANRLLDIYQKANAFNSETCRELALFTAAYFEDIISGFGLWHAFTTLHKEHFGKRLPFYTIDETEYYTDEINEEDIQCLIWMIAQKNGILKKPTIINPENPGLAILAEMVYHVLDSEFEKAPINSILQAFPTTMREETDFFAYREKARMLFFNTYLLTPFTEKRFEQELKEYVEEIKREDLSEEHLALFEYDFIANYLFTTPTGPLALPLHQWLQPFTLDNRDCGKTLNDERSYYKIAKITNDAIVVETISGELKPVQKDSFQFPEGLSKGDTFAGCIIRFKDQYVLNGIMMPLLNDIFEEQRTKAQKNQETIRIVAQKFSQKQNSRLVFAKDMDDLNDHLARIFDIEKSPDIPLGKDDYALAGYLHSTKGFIAYGEMALAISDPANPYYDEANAMENSLRLLMGVFGGDGEMIKYLIDHQLLRGMRLNSLKGKEHGQELMQNNLEFMFRFLQPELFV